MRLCVSLLLVFLCFLVRSLVVLAVSSRHSALFCYLSLSLSLSPTLPCIRSSSSSSSSSCPLHIPLLIAVPIPTTPHTYLPRQLDLTDHPSSRTPPSRLSPSQRPSIPISPSVGLTSSPLHISTLSSCFPHRFPSSSHLPSSFIISPPSPSTVTHLASPKLFRPRPHLTEPLNFHARRRRRKEEESRSKTRRTRGARSFGRRRERNEGGKGRESSLRLRSRCLSPSYHIEI